MWLILYKKKKSSIDLTFCIDPFQFLVCDTSAAFSIKRMNESDLSGVGRREHTVMFLDEESQKGRIIKKGILITLAFGNG